MSTWDTTEVLRAAALEVRPAEFSVYAAGSFLPFTRRELGLLTVLMRNEGRTVAREDLYELVWGGELREGDRTVDIYVHKLRTKLARPLPEWRFIHTHFGFGYRFHPEPASGDNGRITRS